MKKTTAVSLTHVLMMLLIAMPLAFAMAGCGNVAQNIKRDGYQVGDISDGISQDRAWYCGEGMMGIRAVARFVVAAFTGTSVPNLCLVVDVVVGDEVSSEVEDL